MSAFYAGIATFFVALNLILLLLELSWLGRRQPWPRALATGLIVWTALMLAIFFVQFFSPIGWHPFIRRWLYFPLSVEMTWNVLFIQVLVLGALLVTLFLRLTRRVRPADPAPTPADLSRRKFIYLLACGTAPAAAIGMGVHGTLTRYDLRVRTFDIPLANLPPELEGFTIAHVSDLHSGIFCGPRRLQIIREATNDLNADLVAVTGDIINNNMAEFPDALAAVQAMHSRRGLYICEGNHDVIPGAGLVARACRENNLPFLYYQGATLMVENRRVLLAGLPWLGRFPYASPEWIARLYPQREEGDVRILLAHHPHLFDIAGAADLVLAGHTHGGQIMAGDVGLGPLFFRYWSGLYRRDQTTMIVSNGAGDWFPCRIGAPAEIGLIRLKRA